MGQKASSSCVSTTKLLVEVCKMKQRRGVGHSVEYPASKADVFSTTWWRVAGAGAPRDFVDLKA